MMEQAKPPLGVSPHWFVYMKRIKDLNEAIGRFVEYADQHRHTIDAKEYYKVIAQWAKEIEALALLEANLERSDENA